MGVLRYAITEGRLRNAADGSAFEAVTARCEELARDGVEYVLVREKALDAGALVRVCRAVKAVCGGTRVLVSGRADVALAAGLDGVHLSAAPGELTPAQVRRVMPEAYVTVACHSLDEIVQARDAGSDAVLFGPVFGKTVDGVEVVAGVGLERLREACGLGADVFALGGVTAGQAEACAAAGAVGVAGIRLFFEQDLTCAGVGSSVKEC